MKKPIMMPALCMALLSTLFALPCQANLIVNGSFETGDLTGWSPSGNVVIFARPEVTDGSYGATFNWGDTTPNGIISQSFATVPGQQYVLQFDYGVHSYLNQSQNFSVAVLGSSQLLSQTFTDGTPSNPATLAPFSFTFVADSASATLRFVDVAGNNTISTDSVIDNVSVQAVPEPSTYLAGLLLLLPLAFRALRKFCLHKKAV